METHYKKGINMTEGIIDITPHLPAAEMSLEEAFALAATIQEEETN